MQLFTPYTHLTISAHNEINMRYKINIHAHTIFSDGLNSPYKMALTAKEIGFSALVITDHYYGNVCPDFMSKSCMKILKKACKEAREILPIIIGMEVVFMGQEVLVFGMAAINKILENGPPTLEDMVKLRREDGCAVVLCHPGEGFEVTLPVIDGFEQFNSGRDFFKNGRRFGLLSPLPRWCNSDAHIDDGLWVAYNIVDKKITRESDLIRYIKSRKQPEFYISK